MNLRFEIALVLNKLLLQMFPRKFERDELMMIVRAARGRQRFVADGVISRGPGGVVGRGFVRRADRAMSFQIQTKFEAARMKTPSPVKGA
jgi:hypothetical protein